MRKLLSIRNLSFSPLSHANNHINNSRNRLILSSVYQLRKCTNKPLELQNKAEKIRELRRRTGAGISLCIEALNKSESLSAATEYIRDTFKNQSSEFISEKERADGDVSPGLVGIITDISNSFAVIAKLNCQTDFVAKTDEFIDTFRHVMTVIAKSLLEDYEVRSIEKISMDYNDLKDLKLEDSTVDEALKLLSGKVKESIHLDDIVGVQASEGDYIGVYCHWPTKNRIEQQQFIFYYGRIGALAMIQPLALPIKIDDKEMRDSSRKLAIHIVGMLPTSLGGHPEGGSLLDHFTNKSDNSPIDLDEKRRETLLDQPFFLSPSHTVKNWCSSQQISVNDFVLIE